MYWFGLVYIYITEKLNRYIDDTFVTTQSNNRPDILRVHARVIFLRVTRLLAYLVKTDLVYERYFLILHYIYIYIYIWTWYYVCVHTYIRVWMCVFVCVSVNLWLIWYFHKSWWVWSVWRIINTVNCSRNILIVIVIVVAVAVIIIIVIVIVIVAIISILTHIVTIIIIIVLLKLRCLSDKCSDFANYTLRYTLRKDDVNISKNNFNSHYACFLVARKKVARLIP